MKIAFTEQLLWDIHNAFMNVKESYYETTPYGFCKSVLLPELTAIRKEYARKYSNQRFNRLIYSLKKRGFIKIKGEGVMITPEGKKKVTRIRWKTAKHQLREDGKMAMVMYDFPEDKRKSRDLFRSILVSLGYQELQLSVWVSKRKVEEETENVMKEYNLWKYVRLFVIKEVRL